jgi:hypothetical protein
LGGVLEDEEREFLGSGERRKKKVTGESERIRVKTLYPGLLILSVPSQTGSTGRTGSTGKPGGPTALC